MHKISAQEIIIAAMFLVVGLFALFGPTLLSGLHQMQTDPGDTRFNNYVLEHGYQWVLGSPAHADFWNAPIFFPILNATAFSDTLLGSAPLYWLFRFTGAIPETSFQFWQLGVTILNFVVCMCLFRHAMGLGFLASIGGSYLFTFASLRGAQLNYPQLLAQFFSILAVMCLVRIYTDYRKGRRNAAWILALAATCVLQLYAGFYLGFFLGFGMVVFFAVASIFAPARRDIAQVVQRSWPAILVSAAVSAPALYWMAAHYAAAQAHLADSAWSQVSPMVPRITSWIDMGPWSLAYGWTRAFCDFSHLPLEPAHRIGLGILGLGLSAYGLGKTWGWVWGRVLVLFTTLVALAALMYPGGFSPWQLVFQIIPGADAVRFVTRVAFLLLIPLCIGFAVFLDRLPNRKIAAALLVLVCLEQVQITPSFNKWIARARAERIACHVSDRSIPFYAAVQIDDIAQRRSWAYAHLDAMWAQIRTGVATVNGFSGHIPPMWAPLSDMFLLSRTDLIRVHINLCQWADLNGMEKDDIQIVTLAKAPLKSQPLYQERLKLNVGTRAARNFLNPDWGEDETERGLSWAWSLKREASVFVPLKPSEQHRMIMTIAPLPVPGRTQHLEVVLNGRHVDAFDLETGLKQYEVNLPAAAVRAFNKITFRCAYAASPAGLGHGTDSRKLSMALFALEFVQKKTNDRAEN